MLPFQNTTKWFKNKNTLLFPVFAVVAIVSVSPAYAQFGGGGGGGGGNITRTLPAATVTPLASDAPAPWGTDPATVSGLVVEDVMQSPGFTQGKVTNSSGESFFFQSMSSSDFTMESYTKFGSGSTNDPEGNLIFSQEITDPAFGLTEKTVIDSFRQPVSIHSDITERKVAQLTNGLNQMDMHFRQVPFFDSASGKVLVRQDIGVWMTSFAGVMPLDITQSQNFTLSPGDLSHDVAVSIPAGGGGGGGFGGGSPSNGTIDWWNDLEAVKIVDPVNNQLLNFSRCNDFNDPADRGNFNFNSDRGTRDGCSGGGAASSVRSLIPVHDDDNFQLTPINWERWGGSGSDSFSSGLSTNFPNGSGGGGGGFGGF